jgi:LysR family transcriptional regulator, cyn operon transcriptional activator
MNLRNLHTFVIVADAGGFARASGRLNLTQPAATRQILALEQELGVALFARIGRRIQLTSEGEDLLRRSRRVLEDVASLGERARALKAGHVGTLRVGAPTQVIENFLAPFVMQYQRRHPGIEVHLQEAAAARLQTHLDRGDVHLGIMPSGLDPFQGQVLYPIYVTAALARSHQWAHRRVLEIKQLSDNPLLLLGREFGLRAWFEAACDVAHVRPHVLMESVAPHTLIALAGEGYGVAIVPSDVQPQGEKIRLVPLVHRGAPIGRWAVVTWNPNRFLAPYAERFMAELVASVRRSYPGRTVTRRAPPLPPPQRPGSRSKPG